MTTVSIRLPDEISTRLSNLAEHTGRSKTYYVLEALRDRLDDLEDIYLSEQRLIANRAGKSTSIPLEDVMKQYDVEN